MPQAPGAGRLAGVSIAIGLPLMWTSA